MTELLGYTLQPTLERHELANDPNAVVYVSGSHVEGFGNPLSDIDVYVITSQEPVGDSRRERDPCVVVLDLEGPRRVDLEYWKPERVRQIADRLAGATLGVGFDGPLQVAEKEFIHRLDVGIPVGNRDRFEALRAIFDRDRFCRYLVDENIKYLDGGLEDLAGMLEARDWAVGLMTSRDVLDAAVSAWTAHRGSTSSSPKWRLKILQGLASDERTQMVLEDYLRLQFPDAPALLADEAPCSDFLEKCIFFANRITNWIQP